MAPRLLAYAREELSCSHAVMTASSPGRITSATTSTSDCWALLRGGEQYRDRKFLERSGGAGALAAGKFS